MTNKEILQKAIEKAINNGFKHEQMLTENPEMLALQLLSTFNENFLIFSHEFAKVFWGTKKRYDMNLHYEEPIWQYHLQRMVLEKEPLKYLEKFLDD